MSLSVIKLEELLLTNGLHPLEFYYIENELCYVLCVSRLGDNLLIYINSKYQIPIDKNLTGVVPISKYFELIELDVDDKGTLIENVINSHQQIDGKEIYQSTTGFSPQNKGADLEEQLEENYKQDIKFEYKIAPIEWTQQYLQLRRLMNIVKNIKYKLGIVTNKLVFSVKTDNSLNTFKFKIQINIQDRCRIMPTLDIETLYNNLNSLTNDIHIVHSSIINTLTTNHSNNNELFTKVIDKLKHIPQNKSINEFIEETKTYLKNYEDMLQNLIEAEKTAEQKLKETSNNNNLGIKGLHNDIQDAQKQQKHIDTLQKIRDLQSEILNEMQQIKSKQERVLLNLDDLYYCNTIMANAMILNINKVANL